MRHFCSLAVLLLLPLGICKAEVAPAAPIQPPVQPHAQVLVLGVFHMANPGRDLVNMRADDVLSAQRQAQMQELVAVLAKFRPTKIAVEADPDSPKTAKAYADYVAGHAELNRDETQQIGFRLAKTLSHPNIYPADADGDFPYPRVVNYAKASGKTAALNAITQQIEQMVADQGQYLATHTLLETLLYMNTPERVHQDMGYYLEQATFNEPGDMAGVDLVTEWYRRNLHIYQNIMGLIDSPNERVLVIFGAGHLGWLQQDFAANPQIQLRTLGEFVQ